MDRDIQNKLIAWKDQRNKKPLLLTGVRQCGKTFSLKKFGQQYYDNVCYINFESNSQYSPIFDYDFDTKRIISEIELLKNTKIYPKKTLLIFDEIQECPKAITSLKYFAEDYPDIHINAAGSLLGVALSNHNISFPVGKIFRLQMYPLSFKEFLKALGAEKYINLFLEWDYNRPIPDAYLKPMEKYLYQYYIIGGMPEVVKEYTDTNNISTITTIQNNILADYADDFAKHAPIKEIEKLRMIWNSVPKQLAKENKKFIFSHVKQGKRAHELEGALQWLKNAGLINILELVQNPQLPLIVYANAAYFKVYMADIGLLSRRLGLTWQSLINNNYKLNTAKGAITENYVYNELIKLDFCPYYWRSKNSAELDFIFENNAGVIPLEVKSATNTQAKSYNLFCKKYQPYYGCKSSLKNISCNMVSNTKTISLPLFLLWNIKHYL